MNWLLAYLLTGFAISWIGSNILLAKINPNGWKWELAAVVLWPIIFLLVIAGSVIDKLNANDAR